MIRTILIQPAPGDVAMLADGRGGGTMPIWFFGPKWEGDCPLGDRWQPVGRDAPADAPRALVLALDGKAVPEGCDRARRLMIHSPVEPRMAHEYDMEAVHRTAGWAARYLGARVILLDENGGEVAHAE